VFDFGFNSGGYIEMLSKYSAEECAIDDTNHANSGRSSRSQLLRLKSRQKTIPLVNNGTATIYRGLKTV
jgi:hypothetical protein